MGNLYLIEILEAIYTEGNDIQKKIMDLKQDGVSLDEIYEALKELYYSGSIALKKNKGSFDNCFSRGGRGNKVLIIYADDFIKNG